MKICLNAGHKIGIDPGAVGAKSNEASLVMQYAEIAANYLRNVGYTVLVVQENELYDICEASNEFDADLFVSIHCNSALNESAYGTEVFYSETSSNGKKLASCLYNQVYEMMTNERIERLKCCQADGTVRNISDRGLKTNPLYVIKHTVAPAALVEVGFISNKMDEDIMNSCVDQIGAAIARGVSDYYAG